MLVLLVATTKILAVKAGTSIYQQHLLALFVLTTSAFVLLK
jgi:hypothetical protein